MFDSLGFGAWGPWFEVLGFKGPLRISGAPPGFPRVKNNRCCFGVHRRVCVILLAELVKSLKHGV
jgi:hypothetical protein